MKLMTILQNKHYFFLAGVISTLILFAGVATYLRANSDKSIPIPQAEENGSRLVPTPPPNLELPPIQTANPKALTAAKHVGVLLLGYGGPGHQGGFLSDVILLVYFDIQAKKIAFIHIPRDIWVSIPTNSTPISTKINSALAMGTKSGNYPIKDLPSDSVLRGSYLTKMAAKQVTGLDIDFVVGIDFSNFSKAIDSLKGVDVLVTTAFDDQWYPVKGRELELCGHTPEAVTAMTATMSGFNLEKQFPCRYEHLKFAAGDNHMNGDTALKFVRSRHSSSDFARGIRQIQLLQGIQAKLFSLQALDKIPEFFKSIKNMVKTDITLENVTEFAPVLKSLPNFKSIIIGLSTANVLQSGSSKTGGSILIPQAGEGNWPDIHTYIQKEINQ